MEKKCSTCKEIKNISEFHKWKQGKDGYKTECKTCRKLYAKNKRVEAGGKNHPDRRSETETLKLCTKCQTLKSRVSFGKSSWCKECRKDYNRLYSGAKRRFIPIVTETQKQCCLCKQLKDFSQYSPSKRGRLELSSYCKPCSSKKQLKRVSKEDRRNQTQKYRDNNREWWRSLHRINQFNRRNNIKLVSDGTVTPEFVKSIYDKKICYYCEEPTPRKFRTLEHKHPLKKGGKHSIDNITMACLVCNCTKGKKTEQEFKNYINERKNKDISTDSS